MQRGILNLKFDNFTKVRRKPGYKTMYLILRFYEKCILRYLKNEIMYSVLPSPPLNDVALKISKTHNNIQPQRPHVCVTCDGLTRPILPFLWSSLAGLD